MLNLKSLSPRLIKNRISLFQSYIKREPVSRGFPLELAIELTNHCNADCIMCPRQKMSRKKGYMDFDLFKKIADEAKDYVELSFLHLAGEPLLHPDLFRILDYCGKIGLNASLSTNAILLDKVNSQRLIESPLKLLTLSFDGTTKGTYESIRGRSNFEGTRDNIQEFLRYKSKSKNAPHTVIQLIYMKENVNEVRDFIKKWKKSNVDSVRVKPYLNYPGLDEYHGQLPKKSNVKPCVFLWRQLAIYWDGTAVACCMDFLSQMIVGNVAQESIKEIWNGKKMVDMRRIHAKGQSGAISLCKDCPIPQVNTCLLLGTVFFDDLTIKKVLPKIEGLTVFKKFRKLGVFN